MEFAIVSKPIRTIKLTVEQIVAVRSMLRLELVSQLNHLLKVSMFVASTGDMKISDIIGETTQEVMSTVERSEVLERPLVAALGSPYTGMVLDKYKLDKVFDVHFITSDFEKISEIIQSGSYGEYIHYSVEHEAEEDSFHSFIPTLLMLRNRDELVKLFKQESRIPDKETMAYSMPTPRGNFKN